MTRRVSQLRILAATGAFVVGVTALTATVAGQARPVPTRPLAPVTIEEIRTKGTSAELRLSATPDAPRPVLRVDPAGGGDVVTIEEALRRVTAGEIALAAGEHALDPVTLPLGVSLAGGFDPQTWRYDPASNVTVLRPRDSATDAPLIRLVSGSRVSGLVVRDARVAFELAGDGVVLQGIGVSHSGRGVTALRSARGLVTYATFVHTELAVLMESGTEVAVQNSVFQRNGIGVFADGPVPTPAQASDRDLHDPWAFPLASTNNVFFQNGRDSAGIALQRSATLDPGIVRDTRTYPDERAEEVAAALPPAAMEDTEPRRLATPPMRREDGTPFSALRLEVDLVPGDRAFVLDAANGNRPIAVFAASFSGWHPVPTTTAAVLQLELNGDGRLGEGARVTAIGDLEEEDLSLRAPLRGAASTDGAEPGMHGAFDTRAVWLTPTVASMPAVTIGAAEEADLRFLESQLALLTRVHGSGDPVVRGEGDAWVRLPGLFAPGGSPGQQYVHALDGAPRRERSVAALISEAGTVDGTRHRSVLILPSTLAPAEQNLRSEPQRVTVFRLNGGGAMPVREPTLAGLVRAVHSTLGITDAAKEASALAYLHATLGPDAPPGLPALDRLALLYGASVTDATTSDPRREVAVAAWLQALRARRAGDAGVTPPPFDPAACPTLAACPEHAPLPPPALPSLPADMARIVVPAERAEAQGPWVIVTDGLVPGRRSSVHPSASQGLASNGGSASLTYRLTVPRTAEAALTLRRYRNEQSTPFTVTIRGSMGTVELTRGGRGSPAAVDEDLGRYMLAAGEALEVRVSGAELHLGDLVLEAGDPLPTSFTGSLAATDGLAQQGGTVSARGWRADGAISSLRLERPSDPAGVRVAVQIDPGARCRAPSVCPGPVRLLHLESAATVTVDTEGDLLIVGVDGATPLVLPLGPPGLFLLELHVRRGTDGVAVRVDTGTAHGWARAPVARPVTAPLLLELGSSDPAGLTQDGAIFSSLRVIPGSIPGATLQRTARLLPSRRDARGYLVYVSPDPLLVRTRRAPTVNASVRDALVTLPDLAPGVPVTVAVAVLGPDGETSALSELRVVVPDARDPQPAPTATPVFGTAATGASFAATGGLPASQTALALGDRIVLDPFASVPAGTTRHLVSWSIGRDANHAPDLRATHVYQDPGTYLPTARFLRNDGTVVVASVPPVRIPELSRGARAELAVDGVAQAGVPLRLRGIVRGEDGLPPPEGWRIRLDFGDGTPVLDTGDAIRAVFAGQDPTRTLQHTYVTPGAYTLSVTVDDEQGARRATARRTVLVGPMTPFEGMDLRVEPPEPTGPGAVRFTLRDVPEGLTFIGWNFGDALSGVERHELPSAEGLGAYGAPRALTTTPVQLLGDLPVFLRVRDAEGRVALGQSTLRVAAPAASFDLRQRLLFGTVSSGLEGGSIAIFRLGSAGSREYLADVTVDASGFVMLPLAAAGAGEAVAVVRDASDTEVLAVDGTNQLRTAAGELAASLHGFTYTVRAARGTARVRLDFALDASVSADAARGVRVTELADGVRIGSVEGVPALVEGDRALLVFDFARTPRLATGLTLATAAQPTFAPLSVRVLEGERAIAILSLRPEGALGVEAAGGLTLVSDASAQRPLRPGDRVALAARDARGAFSRDLATLTIRAEDIDAGRAPAFGIASGGSRALVPLGTPGADPLTSNSELPTFFGIAPPGAIVEIVTRSVEQRYSVTADERGTWTLVPRAPLGEGEHAVTITVEGTETRFPLVVDVTPPAPPIVTGVEGRTMTGLAEPGSTIVYVDPRRDISGAVVADEEGRFRLTAPERISLLLLKAVDAAGNASDATRFDLVGQTAAGASIPLRTILAGVLAAAGALGLVLVARAARRHPL